MHATYSTSVRPSWLLPPHGTIVLSHFLSTLDYAGAALMLCRKTQRCCGSSRGGFLLRLRLPLGAAWITPSLTVLAPGLNPAFDERRELPTVTALKVGQCPIIARDSMSAQGRPTPARVQAVALKSNPALCRNARSVFLPPCPVIAFLPPRCTKDSTATPCSASSCYSSSCGEV